MKKLLFLLIGLFSINIFCQTDCNIKDEYQKIFKMEKNKFGEKVYLAFNIEKLDESSCFAKLVNENRNYIDYLHLHFTTKELYKNIYSIKDTIKLHNKYIESLRSDSLFNSVMEKFTSKVTNKTNFIPDTVLVERVLEIAVKYFFIMKINDKGHYLAKFCIGINGIKESEETRSPQVEAFCYSTLLEHYVDKEYNMRGEIVKSVKEVYKLNLGVKKEERLLRAQGAMYMNMFHNKKLKEFLLAEYNKKKEYLPFVIK